MLLEAPRRAALQAERMGGQGDARAAHVDLQGLLRAAHEPLQCGFPRRRSIEEVPARQKGEVSVIDDQMHRRLVSEFDLEKADGLDSQRASERASGRLECSVQTEGRPGAAAGAWPRRRYWLRET